MSETNEENPQPNPEQESPKSDHPELQHITPVRYMHETYDKADNFPTRETEQAARLQEERQKLMDYVDKRLSMRDADGKPLPPEAARLAIDSVKAEAMEEMVGILSEAAAKKAVDPMKYEKAQMLMAGAMMADYERELKARDEASVDAKVRDIMSKNPLTRSIWESRNMQDFLNLDIIKRGLKSESHRTRTQQPSSETSEEPKE